ncbi:BON domain-containing protein [Polaromonas sp. DSR2-3-2]|uniref:BON domain-containing protein n=1 Tax=unclassified Polaromonas TaxID=2638319 RepID=UPI003CEB22EA
MKTDTQLQKDAIAELKWEPSVHAEHIGVEVVDGVVTLTGHVNTYAEKINAEHAAERVAGVKALAVEMNVKLTGISKRTDSDIAHSVQNVLLWTTFLTKDTVKIMVEDGWVTLTGEVERAFQRTAADRAFRYLLGVKGVANQITVKTSIASSTIKADIEAALKRRATAESDKLSVAVSGSEVTLQGSCHTWAERELASDASWNAPGVRSVVDNITISYQCRVMKELTQTMGNGTLQSHLVRAGKSRVAVHRRQRHACSVQSHQCLDTAQP